MTDTERRWVSVREFADYLGVSVDHAYKLVEADPEVKRVSRRFGRRVLVCLWAWKQLEAQMAAGTVAEDTGTRRRV